MYYNEDFKFENREGKCEKIENKSAIGFTSKPYNLMKSSVKLPSLTNINVQLPKQTYYQMESAKETKRAQRTGSVIEKDQSFIV